MTHQTFKKMAWGGSLLTAFSIILVALLRPGKRESLFSLEEQRWLDAHPILRLSPNPNFAPVDFLTSDSAHTGVASEFIKIREQVKKILVSGYRDPQVRSKLERSAVQIILQNPYQPETVLRAICNVLDGTGKRPAPKDLIVETKGYTQ
jgi:hypothetical protein